MYRSKRGALENVHGTPLMLVESTTPTGVNFQPKHSRLACALRSAGRTEDDTWPELAPCRTTAETRDEI